MRVVEKSRQNNNIKKIKKDRIMKLNLKDRMIILNSVLPQFDTCSNMVLKISLDKKVALSAEEQKSVVVNPVGSNVYEYGFKDISAITDYKDFYFTDEELLYMKQRIDFIDKNGMFSADTMDSYMKILEALFENEEYQTKWEAHISPSQS